MEKNNGYMDLENEFKMASNEITNILVRTQGLITLIEHIYKDEYKKDEEFITEMQMTQAKLLRLVNKINDIAMKAMAMNNRPLYYKCEDIKLEVRDTMEYVRNLYM